MFAVRIGAPVSFRASLPARGGARTFPPGLPHPTYQAHPPDLAHQAYPACSCPWRRYEEHARDRPGRICVLEGLLMVTNRVLAAALLAIGTLSGACTTSSSAPSEMPPPPTNQNPTISNMSVSPLFGVVGLSQLTLAAAGSDPDGDQVSFQWSVAGQQLSGANQTIPMPGDGPQTASLTVSDGRGGTATDTRPFASGTMTGTWRFMLAQCGTDAYLTLAAVQTGGTWTATVTEAVAGVLCHPPAGTTGGTDPSTPSTIDASGNVAARFKQSGQNDLLLTGAMDTTGPTAGRRIAGTARRVGSTASEQFQLIKP